MIEKIMVKLFDEKCWNKCAGEVPRQFAHVRDADGV